MGKTCILKAIARAGALLEFANPRWTVCSVYVPSPEPSVPVGPMKYITRALHDRGLLCGANGNPPRWVAPVTCPVAVAHMYEWCWERNIIPVLLLDEVERVQDMTET